VNIKITKLHYLEAGIKDTKTAIYIPATYTKLNRTKVDWAFKTVAQRYVKNRKICCQEEKGGSSSTNCMAYIRGNKEDYNDWAKFRNKAWSYGEALPYFQERRTG